MIPYSLIALLIFCPPSHLLSFLRDGEGQREREREGDIPRGSLSLHPLTALSFHVPQYDKSRQDVNPELLLISQCAFPLLYLLTNK